MMSIDQFASERHPLHCSQIPELMFCPWKSVMKFLDQPAREHKSKADTGSAMHKAASAWHKNGKEIKGALASMRKAREEYPLADLHEAEKMFLAYAECPRNQEENVVAVEMLLQGEVEEGIFFEGTTDQIRETEKGLEVWDIKTSEREGIRIRDEHVYQICAYAVLAERKFRRPVAPGGIIMARGFPSRAFFPYTLSVTQAHAMVGHVCDRVRQVRAGQIPPIPGEHCRWCIGTSACFDRHELLLKG